MATYTFTYKVPDILWTNKWDTNATATGTLKLDQAEHKLWFDPEFQTLEYSTLMENIDSAGNLPVTITPFGEPGQSELVEITLTAGTDDKTNMALWIAKHHDGVYGSLDSDEHPAEVYEATPIPVYSSEPGFEDHTYQKETNPHPAKVWELVLNQADDGVDFLANIKNADTFGEINARARRHEVKHYADIYDLGAEAESDATAFLANVSAFITKWDDLKPWMIDHRHIEHQQTAAPKIPMSVASAIATIKQTGMDVGNEFTPWTLSNEAHETELVFLSELE